MSASRKLFQRLTASPIRSQLSLSAASLNTSLRTPVHARLFHATSPAMVVNKATTKEAFNEAIKNNKVVFIDAFAEWCGPCKAISPLIEKLSDDPKFAESVYFLKFDVDELPDLAQELGIRAMPTFITFKDGEKDDTFVGASPQHVQNLLTKAAA